MAGHIPIASSATNERFYTSSTFMLDPEVRFCFFVTARRSCFNANQRTNNPGSHAPGHQLC